MYIVALLGNSLLIFTIITERSLHKPMYVFLCMLAVADLLLSSSSVPKTLSIFWSISKEISFEGCLTQLFIIHFVFVAESGILAAMAFDRYVAICNPLRYTAILTCSVTGKMGAAAVARGFCFIFPVISLLKRLPYCGHNVMPHTYCEHMGVARLACADIRVNIWLGIVVIFLSAGLDTIFIGVSYALILRTIARLPSRGAHMKALNTCGSHICVIFMFYTPAYFSFLTHRFGHHVPKYLLVLLANLYVIIPPMLNPIVYGMKTKEIQARVVQMFPHMRAQH
ncbi:olfactory receptor 52B2-like [Alligator sinensis]|uniref:Olfactory receptor n=1 Tax=Alligator sinensis TaxID=38654 RepID=A0A1U7S8K7_ALLSI|nr:olfactory receptor 52B2-like [Alligator sinensis]